MGLKAATLDTEAGAFRRNLKAKNASDATIKTYLSSVHEFSLFCAREGIVDIDRAAVNEFILSLIDTRARATAETRFKGCKAFFDWLVEEGELEASPMDGMKRPVVPVSPPALLDDTTLRRVLDSCDDSFEGRRDEALLRILIDSGPRRAEIANILMTDVDLDRGLISVTGKGRKPRMVPLSPPTIRAIDKYLRIRRKHSQSALPWFWLGRKGRLTHEGIAQAVYRRGERLGIRLWPHLFRHVSAHRFLEHEGREGDLMQIMGWTSSKMLSRYGAALAQERAISAHQRLDLSL